jgi:Zn-dependent alcohol dehydrogenase
VYERRDVERAVDLLAQGAIPVDALITRVVPLSQINDAFDALEGGGEVKILVDCQGANDA